MSIQRLRLLAGLAGGIAALATGCKGAGMHVDWLGARSTYAPSFTACDDTEDACLLRGVKMGTDTTACVDEHARCTAKGRHPVAVGPPP